MKNPGLTGEGGDPFASSSANSPLIPLDSENPYGKDLYEEYDPDCEDNYNDWRIAEGGEPGVQNERRGGEKWNVWHHGGNGEWENHVASCASYGVLVNGFTWNFADYDARVQDGTVSEEPQIVCVPASFYETSRYVWAPAGMGVDKPVVVDSEAAPVWSSGNDGLDRDVGANGPDPEDGTYFYAPFPLSMPLLMTLPPTVSTMM